MSFLSKLGKFLGNVIKPGEPLRNLGRTVTPRPPPLPRLNDPPPVSTNLGWSQDVFNEYVPAGDRADMREAYAQGFGLHIHHTTRREAEQARRDFLDYLKDSDVDLDDFWGDWRESYEETH